MSRRSLAGPMLHLPADFARTGLGTFESAAKCSDVDTKLAPQCPRPCDFYPHDARPPQKTWPLKKRMTRKSDMSTDSTPRLWRAAMISAAKRALYESWSYIEGVVWPTVCFPSRTWKSS
eukprot:8738886-Alexandrium_andersonii.AAC.1